MNKTIQYLCAGIALLCGTFNISTAVEKRLQRAQARTELRKMMEDATKADRGVLKDDAYRRAQNFIEQQIKRGVLSRHHVRKTTADIRVQLASKAELEKERRGKVTEETKKQITDAEGNLNVLDETADAAQADNTVEELKKQVEAARERRLKLRTEIGKISPVDATEADKKLQALYQQYENKQNDENFLKELDAARKNADEAGDSAYGEYEKQEKELEKQLTELQEKLEDAEEKAAEELKEQEAALQKQQEEEKAKLQKETQQKEEKNQIINKIVKRQARIFTWKDYLPDNALNNANFAGDGALTKDQNTKDNLQDEDEDRLKAYAEKLNNIKKTARDSAFAHFIIMSKLAQHIIRNFEDNKEAIKDLKIQKLNTEEKESVGDDTKNLKKLTLTINNQDKMDLLEGAPKERIETLIKDLEAINIKLKENVRLSNDNITDIRTSAIQEGQEKAKAYEKKKKNK